MSTKLESWRIATILLVVVSVAVFLVQRTSWAIFDTVFEICIFHVPSLFSALLYMRYVGEGA